MKKSAKKAAFTVPISLIVLTVAAMLFSVKMAAESRGGVIRLYRDIGATPWHDPDIVISAEHSDKYTDSDIQQAIDSALDTYNEEWHTFNGVYMLELHYDDEFSESRQGTDPGDWIYLSSRMYTGYAGTVSRRFRGIFHSEAYWAVKKMPDGSWDCRGCGSLNDDDK